MIPHSTFPPHDRTLRCDWTPLLSALGVFLSTYLRDTTEHQRALRPFVLSPQLPARSALPTLLGLAEPRQVTGLDYLLQSAGLLQNARTDAMTVLPQPTLDWSVLDQVLTALLPALDPAHADHAPAHAAARVLEQGGLLHHGEPAHLFYGDGAWPDLLPLLMDDARWQQLFSHLHGTDALVSYWERARTWVVDARQERARRDQAQAELAAYLLAAQRGQEPDAGPGSSDPPAGGGSGTPGSGPGGRAPDAPDSVATRSPPPAVAGDPDPRATRPTPSLADQQGVAAGSSPGATSGVDRPAQPPITLSLPESRVSLSDRSLTGDSLTTLDSFNDSITTTTLDSPSNTTSDIQPLVEQHLRSEELASTRLDAAFWQAVNHILTGSATRYPHTPGEKKAAERHFKRQQIPIGVVLAALRTVVSLPDRPGTFAAALDRPAFHACVQHALTLLPQPSTGRDWPAFLHAYRQIGRVAGLRDVRPGDYTALQGLFRAQPERCWQVLARWAEVPPARVSVATLRRASTAPVRSTASLRVQPPLPWDAPPTLAADDPRRALLITAGLSPRLLTPGITEDYLRAWIAEADARADTLTSRAGWLTWGIRSGHWPETHPQLRQRRTVHCTPPAPVVPAVPPRAPVSAEQVAWQEVWSAVQTRLSEHVPAQDYATWLQETALVDLEHGQAIIATPNIFARERVAEHYAPLIAHALQQQTHQSVQVQVVLDQRSFGFGGGA